MKTILILKEIRKPNWLYLIDALAVRWKKLGYNVLTHYGTKNLPDADTRGMPDTMLSQGENAPEKNQN